MSTNAVTKYLKFAHLQMAAESLFSGTTPIAGIGVADILTGDDMTEDTLLRGNERASKFTPTLAAEFMKYWELVEHQANTATGFSGTLFRARQSADIAAEQAERGITPGELVMSFRSTEFADDMARAN
jgi:hypothetical protein